MFSYKNFSQLAATLQELDVLGLSRDESAFFVKTELDRAKEALRAMKNARQILGSLYRDVMTEITALTTSIMPAVLHRGLDDIPDELLIPILTMDSCYGGRRRRPEELMLVSKRFRVVISSTPECWSRIEGSGLRRRIFQDAPIDLKITCHTAAEDMKYYEGRIRCLEVDNYQVSLQDKAEGFPSVRSLILHHDDSGDILKCSFPQLTSLTCHRIPPPGIFPHLIHCVLDLPVEYWYADTRSEDPLPKDVPDYDGLARFLASTPTLQSLSFPVDTGTLLYWSRSSTITLPSLRYLHIRCNRLCDMFLEVLDCPNLEAVEVLLDPFYEGQSKDGTDSDPAFRLSSVTSLTIRGVTHYRLDEDMNLYIELNDIHRTFPRLQRLSIDGDFCLKGSDQIHRAQNDDISLDRLAWVYIRVPLIDLFENEGQLSSIFRWYKENGAYPRLLEVRDRVRGDSGRDKLTMKELSTLFPSTKIQLDNYS